MSLNFQKYFNKPIQKIIDLNHRGNNKLYKIITSDKNYLLKQYSTIQKDNWNRGEVEFRAISHFWGKGFREVPEPINFDKKESIGIYSFEKGETIPPKQVREEEIFTASNFLAKLHNLGIEDKKSFPLERTNCLCISDYLNLIQTRIKTISEDFAAGEDAKSFWEKVVLKAESLKESFYEKGIDLTKKLSLDEQVITPGDFGFHNMLVNKGDYIFLDFEYCGRDDPAKQIVDFLHHDRTKEIDTNLKDKFLLKYLEKTNHKENFKQRLHLIDPLIGMNWVLIYLNPLYKTYQKHMKFAGHSNIEEIIRERLTKAGKKLNKLKYFK